MAEGLDGISTVCLVCGARNPGIHPRCPTCGGPAILDVPDPKWDLMRDVPSMWRYAGMLPGFARTVSLGEGLTPVRRVGGAFVKLEGRNPTGSYADRASSVIASYVASGNPGVGRVAVEYSEDFTYSMAMYMRGIADVDVAIPDPSRIDPSEIVALVGLGARMRFGRVGDGLMYASSLAVEGLKTIALEIVERHPRIERIVVPAETGLLALSIWKGLRDAADAGIDVAPEVDAAVLEGSQAPELFNSAGDVRVHTVGLEESIEGLVRLAGSGIRAKMLSAAAFALADELGGGLAIVTVAQRRQAARRTRESGLMDDVEAAVARLGEASAYDVWGRLRGYSLRGVYKAIAALEVDGRLCARYRIRGGRKVRMYFPCGSHTGSRAITG